MCLLVFSEAGSKIDISRLEQAALNNPDGFGFAIHCGDSIIRDKGMDFYEVLEKFEKQRAIHHGHAMFHLRIATHGSVNKKNCHPFVVGNDARTVLGHNGVLPFEMPKNDVRSDTKYFAEVLLPKHGGVVALNDPEYREKLAKQITGSKFVIMTADPRADKQWYIINEQAGHWDEGVWWSNKSYEKWIPAPKFVKSLWGYDSYYTPTPPDPIGEYIVNEYILDCEFCESDYIVNEELGQTLCPTCKTCLFCHEVPDDCLCGSSDQYSEPADYILESK